MTSSRFGVSAIIAGLVLVAGVQPARATFMTFGFEGFVGTIVDPTYTIFPEFVQPGSILTGTITLDLDTPGESDWPNSYGTIYNGAIVAVQGQMGSISFHLTNRASSTAWIQDDAPPTGSWEPGPWDSYGNGADVTFPGHMWGGIERTYFSFALAELTGAVFSSEDLPAAIPPLSAFVDPRIWARQLHFGGGGFPGTTCLITDLWNVPEPSSLLFVLIGAVLAARRKSRR